METWATKQSDARQCSSIHQMLGIEMQWGKPDVLSKLFWVSGALIVTIEGSLKELSTSVVDLPLVVIPFLLLEALYILYCITLLKSKLCTIYIHLLYIIISIYLP